jgi:hypothetical protein
MLAEYVHDTVLILFQLGAFRIQSLQRTHVETVYSGMNYTFPVLLIHSLSLSTAILITTILVHTVQ